MAKTWINLRGTSGSGKTTVAKDFLREHPWEALKKDGKAVGVRVELGLRDPLFLLGRYDPSLAFGGMDGIATQEECAELGRKAYAHGHVLCEGLLATGIGPKGALPRTMMEEAGRRAVFACLDTPLEACLERVRLRRIANGNEKPLVRKTIEDLWHRNVEAAERLRAGGARVVDVPWSAPYAFVLGLIREADACPD